jgi:hypothetical protein
MRGDDLPMTDDPAARRDGPRDMATPQRRRGLAVERLATFSEGAGGGNLAGFASMGAPLTATSG